MSGNQQTLSTTLRQEQQLSARQLQSLELLNLPLLELEERLMQAMAAIRCWRRKAPTTCPEPEPPAPAEAEDEANFDAEAAEADEWRDDLPLPSDNCARDDDCRTPRISAQSR